jgi:hypothetical protein
MQHMIMRILDINMEIRKFEKQEERVETGPIQFGDDWPGVFIRGDNALAYVFYLQNMLEQLDKSNCDVFMRCNIEGLIRLLTSCDVRNISN